MTETRTATPRPKGPRVFLDYDQEALDAAYNQRAYAPNAEQVLARWASCSAQTLARLGPPERIAYGPTEIERLEVHRTGARSAPIAVFIHGGAWRSTLARDYAFVAELFVRAGAHCVIPDFAWVQDVGGSLLPMADQVRRAVAFTHANAARFGGDPDRLYVIGQSSGGHLAGVVLTTDWSAYRMPADGIKGGICISGMYDLAPVRLSARSAYIGFDDETVAALSPIRHIDRVRAPIIVAYGSYETPEFQRQPREFAARIAEAGKPVELLVGENYNHFEFIEALANPYGVLGTAALRMMRLGG